MFGDLDLIWDYAEDGDLIHNPLEYDPQAVIIPLEKLPELF